MRKMKATQPVYLYPKTVGFSLFHTTSELSQGDDISNNRAMIYVLKDLYSSKLQGL